MGATNTLAPFGIFWEGGAFFSPACAVVTAAAIKKKTMLTTRLLAIGHLSSFCRQSGALLNHNLLDVFGACFSRALPSTHGVGFVNGVPEDDRSGLQVGDLDTRLFVGVLYANEQHLRP